MRYKYVKLAEGSLDPTVVGESNPDGSITLFFQAEHYVGSVVIAQGQSLSPLIDTGGRRLAAVAIPSNWTAASISFQASVDGGVTFFDLYDDAGNEVVLTATANRMLVFDALAVMLAPFRYLKIRSGTAGGGAVPQTGADKTLGYATRGV